MAYPDGYLWEFPGMYSITVQYGIQNNFFFCPFVGLLVINFCEFKDNKFYKLAIVTMFTLVCISLMLLFTRGYYSIDLFGGVLFGHYFWIMGERISWVIDFLLMNIPFHKRFPNFPKKCFNCKAAIN